MIIKFSEFIQLYKSLSQKCEVLSNKKNINNDITKIKKSALEYKWNNNNNNNNNNNIFF